MGTHKELLESCTAYQAIFDSQIGEEWSREPDSGIKEHAVKQMKNQTSGGQQAKHRAGKAGADCEQKHD
jgi:Rod binding domain-containing protein